MQDPARLAALTNPPHLAEEKEAPTDPGLVELRKRMGGPVDEETAAKKIADAEAMAREAADKQERRTAREYLFSIDITAGRRRYAGNFVSTVPSLKQQGEIGVYRAVLSGNTPFDALDPNTRELNFLVANLTLRLSAPKGEALPAWFKNMQQEPLPLSVLHALWEEVNAHAATFLE